MTIRLHAYIPSCSIKWQHQPWQSHWRLRKASFLCKEVQSLISHSPNTSTIYLIDISFKEIIQRVSFKWVENQQQPSPSSVFFTILTSFSTENWQEKNPTTTPPGTSPHPSTCAGKGRCTFRPLRRKLGLVQRGSSSSLKRPKTELPYLENPPGVDMNNELLVG